TVSLRPAPGVGRRPCELRARAAELTGARARICDPAAVDSLAGKLLVSSPSLHDPNFRRTVLLMTHHDEEGAMGLVLSRPSEIRVGDAVPELADLPGADELVYVGGPVQPEAVAVLIEHESEPDLAIVGNVAFMPA